MRARRFDIRHSIAACGFLMAGMGTSSAAAALRTASASLGLAATAAEAWADDAALVWLENDAPVDAEGRAEAWGYLYYSAAKGAMRSYSVRGNEIVHAEDHTVRASAPALEAGWIDSAAIMSRIQNKARSLGAGTSKPESLLLVRGVFHAERAWVAVFAAGTGPRLHVVFDATSGEFVRSWRG